MPLTGRAALAALAASGLAAVAASGTAAVAASVTVAVAAPPVPATPVSVRPAAEGPDCTGTQADAPRADVTGTNLPHDTLQVAEATERLGREGRDPGAGVTVVVVDSGVRPELADDQQVVRGTPEIPDPHGTVVAGIVAGPEDDDLPVGVAPAARVVSLKVHDTGYGASDDPEQAEPSADAVADALGRVRARRGELGDRVVVVVPYAVPRTSGLAAAVRALDEAGVLVVAAVGDRPEPDSGSPLDGFAGEDGVPPGEDATRQAWPAGFRSVLAVGASTSGADPTSSLAVQNSDVDVAAPTFGGVSYGLNGHPCVVTTVSSEYAAAYVAGVAALVWSGRPSDDADDLRERLVRTADGGTDPDAASRATGHGVVQPVEALGRRTLPDESGRRDEVARRAEAPDARADVLASTRRDAVWWGLGGGTALVVALLLRPVLARRRR